MFYKMISTARDRWYGSDNCTVKALVDYIIQTGQMRDAQVEAIKTYLFLKIACGNQPLADLFSQGIFNNLNLNDVELKSGVKDYLANNPAAAALFEYASWTDGNGGQFAPKVVAAIKENPDSIVYDAVFKKAFYDVSYTDYLFSLPMGAGKTYLMAAFIYLDLYFAGNEPDNKAFAHNFIIFAPSGLKTSVVPSLRTIQNFDPAWIIPEPSATELKRKLIFEVLDQNKSEKKSNKTKNPNVQKIAIHQPLEDLFGLVAVTNAEKVILDRIVERNGQISLLEDSDDDRDKQANELRNLIGKLPSLSVFIDEVHHAATDDKKLRAVVSKWMQNKTVNSVIGFSGTPYLPSAEKIQIAGNLKIASPEISNIVYYYPLVSGIGNFLKKPNVFISDSKNRFEIAESGIRAFLDSYKDTVYPDGTCAKLGIYCGGSIEILEEQIYPLAARVAEEYGLNAADAILKFHGGNKSYPLPQDSALEFESLDKPFSKKRIVLLVQIGKEGWDCRSLTGIILSQENDCPTNMVLQTSCRCLRQVQKGAPETALIYLNEANAATLNMQLEQQHHISIREFQSGASGIDTIKRYDRTAYLKLPKVDFYQLKVNYKTLVVDEELYTEQAIAASCDGAENAVVVKEAEFGAKLVVSEIYTEFADSGAVIADFNAWLYEIAKGSFGFVTMPMLLKYESLLKTVFDKIVYQKDSFTCFRSKYDIAKINAAIRKAFYEKRTFETSEELIPEEASLLKVENFKSEVQTADKTLYFPDAQTVENIVKDDAGKLKPDKKTQQLIALAEKAGQTAIAETLKKQTTSHPMKDKSFHYLPYKGDSGFEQLFLEEALKLDVVKNGGLEVYYNGDRALTEFKIKCYRQTAKRWDYVGMYTPDFLIIKRQAGKIIKALIVETKGRIYANDPAFAAKREFMSSAFIVKNTEKFGYKRFDYLYLQDDWGDSERITKTAEKIKAFFREEA
jgi:type III restriction enzyme